MKGLIDQYGEDKLSYVLLNIGGNDARTITAADERIRTYGMQALPRVRMDYEESARILPPAFGQFGYGYFILDAKGRLAATRVHGRELQKQLQQLLGPAKQDDDAADPLKDLWVKARVRKQKGGRKGFDLSRKLPREMTCEIAIDLNLPDGYHVYGLGKANPTPTEIKVAYADGLTIGKPRLQNAEGEPDGVQTATGRAALRLPVTVPKGTPIGNYFAHGTVRFLACDEDGCLPPLELPWSVKIPAL